MVYTYIFNQNIFTELQTLPPLTQGVQIKDVPLYMWTYKRSCQPYNVPYMYFPDIISCHWLYNTCINLNSEQCSNCFSYLLFQIVTSTVWAVLHLHKNCWHLQQWKIIYGHFYISLLLLTPLVSSKARAIMLLLGCVCVCVCVCLCVSLLTILQMEKIIEEILPLLLYQLIRYHNHLL